MHGFRWQREPQCHNNPTAPSSNMRVSFLHAQTCIIHTACCLVMDHTHWCILSSSSSDRTVVVTSCFLWTAKVFSYTCTLFLVGILLQILFSIFNSFIPAGTGAKYKSNKQLGVTSLCQLVSVVNNEASLDHCLATEKAAWRQWKKQINII